MSVLLGFAPFIVFAIVDRLLGPTEGLIAAAVVSAALLLREVVVLHRAPKILELGTLILFGGLAVYSIVMQPAWSIIGIRLRVDVGLLAIVLLSIVLRRPFTLQYAREQADATHEESPLFLRTNDVISAVWAVAFAIMVAADLVMLDWPEVPLRAGIIATIVALYGAIKFTSWYPAHLRAKAVAQA